MAALGKSFAARLAGAAVRLAVGGGLVVAAACQFGRFSASLDMLSALLVPVAVLLAVAATAALWRKDWPFAAAALIALALTGSQLLGMLMSAAPRDPPAGAQLRIVSLNAYHDNPDPAALRRIVERLAPDIVMIQEADGTARKEIAKLLPGYFRVGSCSDRACSLAIVSRWPVTRCVPDRRAEAKLPDLLAARVMAPFGTFTVVTAHLPRPNLPEADRFRGLLVRAITAQASTPVLVGGDLNLPTGSFALAGFARDAGIKRADRWIPTYPAEAGLPAFAAIDHLFIGRGWRVQQCARLPDTGSDHYGLMCTISGDRPNPAPS